MSPSDILLSQWRVGRKLGRSIYAMKIDGRPRDDDEFIGIVDSLALAQHIVDAHNHILEMGL